MGFPSLLKRNKHINTYAEVTKKSEHGGKCLVSVEDMRKQNVDEAKSIFENFVAIVESGAVPWEWQKKRKDRTEFVLSTMSFFRLLREEYVYFNPKYLKNVLDVWKALEEDHPEVGKWIKIYEERLKLKGMSGEIGERVVDLSSSLYPVPVSLITAMEYEAVPEWGSIIGDFRKLLSVLARVKVGIFHLPPWSQTSRVWDQNEETGEIKWVVKVLDSDKLDQFGDEISREIRYNELEHPYTVYLLMLIRVRPERTEVNLYGYLFWRKASGEVNRETLEPKIFKF